MKELEMTISSLEVAEMMGKEHKHLLRDIRTYIQHLESPNMGFPAVEEYFIESSYVTRQNREMPMYKVTRKGCDLVATRMSGATGTQFAMRYIDRFHEMESHIKSGELPAVKQEDLILMIAQSNADQAKRLENVEARVEETKETVKQLEETMRIDSHQEYSLQRFARSRVVKALGGKGSRAYKQLSRKAFARFWRDFKDHFYLPRYSDLPKKKYDEAIEFIGLWEPDTSLKIEIRSADQYPVAIVPFEREHQELHS